MKQLVKICGFKTRESAARVLEFKPDMLGLVLVESSPRKVSMTEARKIAQMAKKAQIAVVAVFQNEDMGKVVETVGYLGIDYVQLHGSEDTVFCKQMPVKVIKTVRLEDSVDKTRRVMQRYRLVADLFLIDRLRQGEGKMVDLDQVKQLAETYPVLIGGGLTPANVKTSLRQVGSKVIGVDVSGGVEQEAGVKDVEKVEQFITEVREVYAS